MAVTEEEKGLHNLRPSKGATRPRKRVGRGPASGTGKTSGRGQKGQKSRSGSHMVRAGFEGGQMPLYMRIGKLRGSNKKMSMPMGPFRTNTQPVNVGKLGGFEKGTEVTPELLLTVGILRNLRHPVKILGGGELEVALTIVASGFSDSARQKIEAAGGTVKLLPGRPLNAKAKKAAEAADNGETGAARRRTAAAGAAETAPKAAAPATESAVDAAPESSDESPTES